MPKTKEAEAVAEKVELDIDVIASDMKKLESDGVKVRRPQPSSVAANQLHYFAGQAQVRYRLPKSAGDTTSYETCCVNDLLITVMKGQTVSLPEDVAKYFDDSQSITDNALRVGSLDDNNLPGQLQK